MANNQEIRVVYLQMTAMAFALVALLFFAAASQASVLNSCSYCHGMPPRDGVRKANPHFGSQSSAFSGNHRSHLPTAAVATDCNVCHTAVSATGFGHQNDVIVMANSLKGYSSATLRAKYDKGVFFNMTSVPNLTNATCSNVSCHFEKKTPAWGGAAYNPATDCNACHGAPPSGTAGTAVGGLAGSHARHDVYYPGTANCQKCHPNYTTFSHATSAGRALKVSGYLRNPSNTLEASATYSGTGANYLPSKSASQVFGSCTIIYCHSSGQSATGTATGITYKSVAWGSATLTCAGCHVDEATDATGTGSHRIHTLSTGANFDCVKCHLGYTKSTVTTTTHVNGLIELGAAGFTYSQGSGATHPPANGFGTCSASTCHGSAAVVTWGGTLYSTTDQCAKCHASTIAGAITQAAPFYSTAYPTKVTLNTDAKVGAHTNHMTSQTLGISASTACADCHGSVTLNGATHMDGATTLAWSALATRTGALTPAYNASTGQCTATYCHGNSMPGGDASGSNKSPIWKDPNYLPATISAAACGVCHGFPPTTAAGHPAVTIPAGFPATATIGTTCSCHSNINTAGNSYANMFVNPALHINGILETPSSGHAFPYGGSLHLSAAGVTPWSSCTACHTNAAGGTYPVASGTAPNCTACHINGLRAPSGTSSCWDCHGASATDGKPSSNVFPNISGNHTAHMAITGTTCATCHTGGGNGTATHGSSNRVAATAASVKVAFTGQGAAPLWTTATKTCSATNCHGQGAPAWGARIGALVNGFPYSSTQCATCHSGNLATDVTAAAPFYSTAIPKVTLTTDAKVGAHTSHMTSTDSLSAAFTCADCHGTVTLTAASHMNGVTNFTWSTLATKGGTLTPTYTAATGVCANVYCHGASMPGGDTTGTNRAPTWNSSTYLPATIGAGGTACKTCHGFPPATASGHPALTTAVPATFGNGTVAIGSSCNCHANINTAGTTYANIFVNKAQHIDGTLQVSGGHAVPYDTHNAAVVAAGGNTACLGCHAMGTSASVYPAAVAGNPPDCMSCHKKAAPLHTGTTAGANCSSCHGLSTGSGAAIGRPNGTAFPDKAGRHSSSASEHTSAACTRCHSGLGTAGGTGSGVNHGRGSTAGPVRDGKPNVVGPGFAAGITLTGGTKGTSPAVSCNHTTIGTGCTGGGTKTW
ncbi:MAG: CxxxxCH/CxxCH domain-containing protein [Desulfuromonadales bacterium]|nr:CxxxxCH/CxxCH domain-containing protein [Desulfuromonadales bacterium]